MGRKTDQISWMIQNKWIDEHLYQLTHFSTTTHTTTKNININININIFVKISIRACSVLAKITNFQIYIATYIQQTGLGFLIEHTYILIQSITL